MTALDTRTIARLIDVTPRRLQQLAHGGWIEPAGRGQWPLVPTVQGYLRFLRSRIGAEKPSAAALHDAKAQEIEQRLRRQDRDLVTMAEAAGTITEVGGLFEEAIRRLPRRISKGSRERQRLAAICESEADRLASRNRQTLAALKTGRADDETEEED
ncbi:hypothetical protein [Mesorhizobium sp.]|uniref:hypothetical protein n=1 Tax=Mesorhizobium sp. TaxID=1871066 RepID=UPI000FE68C5A|nr:hypothetical protein [Mesorhizobium sp.]RWM08952.1 MAG: hypothetical protein EOR71_10585 [Mesorhizobium sp.]